MKHIVSLTKKSPRKADAVQDFICRFLTILSDILGAFGGASPFLGYLTDKCDVPTPNPE